MMVLFHYNAMCIPRVATPEEEEAVRKDAMDHGDGEGRIVDEQGSIWIGYVDSIIDAVYEFPDEGGGG